MSKSLNPTWGRIAASRFSKSDEEVRTEILKALEGKLSKEFQVGEFNLYSINKAANILFACWFFQGHVIH